MSCPNCGFIESKNPYRQAAGFKVEKKEKRSYFPMVRLPNFMRIESVKDTLLGLLSIISIVGLLWVMFPGAYELGMYLGNDVLHWNIRDIEYGPGGWIIGILAITCPILLILALIFARAIGSYVRTKYLKRNK